MRLANTNLCIICKLEFASWNVFCFETSSSLPLSNKSFTQDCAMMYILLILNSCVFLKSGLSVFVLSRPGESLLCEGGDVLQMWKFAGNVLNKESRTVDKCGPPVWRLGRG
jgi:hypothetical protein